VTQTRRRATGVAYTGFLIAFLALAAVLAVLEQVGVPDPVIGYVMVGGPTAIFIVIAFACRTMKLQDYFTAGHRVPAVFNGLATFAALASGTAFLGLAGAVYRYGYDGLAIPLGWCGGLIVMSIFTAPALRASQSWTIPEFLGSRYRSSAVRVAAAIALAWSAFLLLAAEMALLGRVASDFLGMPYGTALAVTSVLLLVLTVPGGMRSVSWAQAAQALVIIVALFVPVALVSMRFYGTPLPQQALGRIFDDLSAIRSVVGTHDTAGASFGGLLAPFAGIGAGRFFILAGCILLGTAAMPHLLARAVAAPNGQAARRSALWALPLVIAFALTAPFYGLLAELASGGNLGRPDAAALVADFPALANLPFAASALITVGALAAALATAGGLLLAAGNSLAHDIWDATLGRSAPTMSRIFRARLGSVLTAAVAGSCAYSGTAGAASGMVWSFAIAAACLFPPIAIGIVWRGATWKSALCGMGAGAATLLGLTLLDAAPGVSAVGAGDLIGAPSVALAGIAGAAMDFAAITLAVLAERRLGVFASRKSETVPDGAATAAPS